jgi:hypothetical protein
MLRLGCRVRIGGRLAASICASIGVAALASGWTSDSAAAKSRRDDKRDEAVVSRPLGTPVMAIVSIKQQRVTIYDTEGPMLQAPVSTGTSGYETPAGIYTVLEKRAEHYSNLYDDAAMPFMQRLTWSGIALHAGALPGYPASHGCVRMPIGFAERLFERTKLGMRVVVVRDDISPADFAHPALFKPLPADAPPLIGAAAEVVAKQATQVAEVSPAVNAVPPTRPRVSLRAEAAAKAAAAAAAATAVEEKRKAARSATIEAGRATKALRRAEAVKVRAEQQLRLADRWVEGNRANERAQQAKASAQEALRTAQTELDKVTAEMQPKIDLAARLRDEAKQAAAVNVAAQDEAKATARKLLPVSVFISRATQRLYVRQAREPVLDMPITIADADRPLGTYIYTALAYTQGETNMRWSVVSMYGPKGGPGGKPRDRQASAVPADHAGAKAALDRITIPKEAADRISEMVGPGSSLIVSDEALSRETGAGTEFIVVMSGEPQGGIKIRARPAEARNRYQQRPAPSSSPFGWSGPSPFSFW